MLVVVSGSFTLAFGADFTFQISGLGLSKCHSTLTPLIDLFLSKMVGNFNCRNYRQSTNSDDTIRN